MKLKELAAEANKIEDEIGLNIDDVLNKITQELGEFNDAVQKYRGRYTRAKSENLNDVEEELGDLLFNLFSVSHRLGVDVDAVAGLAENTLNKFKERKELYLKNAG